jgi:hypothetical protein
MERVKTLNYKNKNIVYVDVSDCMPEESIKTLPEAKKIIASQPLGSVLVLMKVTNAHYNKEAAEAIKEFVQHNTPYVKASAVVGAEGIRMVLLTTVALLARREIKTFNTVEEAKDWLVSIY